MPIFKTSSTALLLVYYMILVVLTISLSVTSCANAVPIPIAEWNPLDILSNPGVSWSDLNDVVLNWSAWATKVHRHFVCRTNKKSCIIDYTRKRDVPREIFLCKIFFILMIGGGHYFYSLRRHPTSLRVPSLGVAVHIQIDVLLYTNSKLHGHIRPPVHLSP